MKIPKNRQKTVAFLRTLAILFTLLSSFCFSACNNIYAPEKTGGYGRVSVLIDGTERTLFPSTVFSNYEYTFTKQDGDPKALTPSDGVFILEPGSWNVSVKAYTGSIIAGNLAAAGEADFTLEADETKEVQLILTLAEATGGTGTFSYYIRYPSGTSIVNFTLKEMSLGTSVNFSPSAGSTNTNGTVNNVPAGTYLLNLRLKNNDRYAGTSQIVYIYKGLSTIYGTSTDPIVFNSWAFTELPPLTGTISIIGNPYTGEILSVDKTGLNGSGEISYQWKRGTSENNINTNIAQTESYTIPSSSTTGTLGSYYTVTVTREDNSGSITSPVIGPVILPPLEGTVFITGNPVVGLTLRADTTNLIGIGNITYQWKSGDTAASLTENITTGSSYKIDSSYLGKYIAVTVTRAGYSGSLTSNVIGPVGETFLFIDDVSEYLSGLGYNDGNNSSYPVNLSLSIYLGDMQQADSGWKNLLNIIGNSNKYVSLDLSACTMHGTEFNPDYNTSTGKSNIIDIKLPNTALSITDGIDYYYSAFYYFNNLKTISATNLTSVGNYAFYNRTYLTTVDFPAVNIIDDYAFSGCTSLNNLDISSVTSIGSYVFQSTGSTGMTITMKGSAPSVGINIFDYVYYTKYVTVKIPAGEASYGSSPVNTTEENWGNVFRGRGSYLTGSVNSYIYLTISQEL